MSSIARNVAAALTCGLIAAPAAAQPRAAEAAPPLSYARMADMALAAPIAAGVSIRKAQRLKGDIAVGVPPGQARMLVEADTQALIRGANGLPARTTYLVDVPLDAANRVPKLKGRRMLLLAAPGRPGELRLIAPGAQIDWTPEAESRLRAIITAAVAPDAPPRITGIGNAFHVQGTLPGESESQIFLTTADGRPVSLSILRRPGEQAAWSVSLGEMLDTGAEPPRRDTLLWYRLACFLPQSVPADVMERIDPAMAVPVSADYSLVMAGLGRCDR